MRVLKLDSEVALPGSGAWEQPPSRPWGARSAFPSRSLRSNVARGYGSPGRDPRVPLDMRARDDSALTEVGCSPQAAAAYKLKGTPGPGPQQGA